MKDHVQKLIDDYLIIEKEIEDMIEEIDKEFVTLVESKKAQAVKINESYQLIRQECVDNINKLQLKGKITDNINMIKEYFEFNADLSEFEKLENVLMSNVTSNISYLNNMNVEE